MLSEKKQLDINIYDIAYRNSAVLNLMFFS